MLINSLFFLHIYIIINKLLLKKPKYGIYIVYQTQEAHNILWKLGEKKKGEIRTAFFHESVGILVDSLFGLDALF